MPSNTYDEPSLTALAASITTTENNPTRSAREPHAPLFGKYELGKLLGCGGFAKVYHARDIQTGESVAVKVVSKRKIERFNLTAHAKREVSIMRRLNHPHIIRLIEVLATRTKIYFIMEFAKGGELFSKLSKGRFSEDLSRKYFHQLISAVGYCHSHGIFHRDLKPENILLDENWKLKISDFGLSAERTRPEADQIFHTLCGTPAYVAPEILAKKGYDGAKIDIWSCGITLFVLNAGYLPFNDTNIMNLYRKIYRGEYRCPKWFSPELKRFLGRLLDTDPETRITIEEIFEDPWFKVGFTEVKPIWHDCENDNKMVKKGQYLNAFDLISFSPRFNLSGLFGVDEESCSEMLVAVAEEAEVVVGRIEEVARGIHTPRVEVGRVKGGMGVQIQAQNGNLLLVVEVYKLTKELVVVEVRKSEKDVGPSEVFWRGELKPRIRHLFVESGRTGSRPGSVRR